MKYLIGAAFLYFVFRNSDAKALEPAPASQDSAPSLTEPLVSEPITASEQPDGMEDVQIKYVLPYAAHLGVMTETVKAADLFFDKNSAEAEASYRAANKEKWYRTDGDWVAEPIKLEDGRDAWIITFHIWLRTM